MSKIIRKARNQLHSVREDGLRRQLHAARSDLKHTKRSTGGSHHAAATPGFKFSDIDNNDMNDFDWMDPESGTRTEPGSSNQIPKSEGIQTSDYYSSHSSLEASYSHDSSPVDSSTDKNNDYLFDEEGSEKPNLITDAWSKSFNESTKNDSESLFDDGPDLEGDFVGSMSTNQANDSDLFGMQPSSKPPSMYSSLFDEIPCSSASKEDNSENSDSEATGCKTQKNTSSAEESLITASMQTNKSEETISTQPGSSNTTILFPSISPADSAEHQEQSNTEQPIGDELFTSSVIDKQTLTSSNNATTSSDVNSAPQSLLTLSETLEDPLSMINEDDPDESSQSDQVQSPFFEAENHPLLAISEDHYGTPKDLAPDPATPSNTLSVQSSLSSSPSTPQQKSPALLPKYDSPSPSPTTAMKLSRSGKKVPVVPPRPSCTKRTMSAPDPDALSLISNVSSISAYSADEIYNRRAGTNSIGSTIGSGFANDVQSYQSLEHIIESDDMEEQASSDSDYTLPILSLVWLLLYLYYSLNPFVYLAGFLAGFLVFYVTIGSAFYWYVQHSEREKERRKANLRKVELPALEDLPKTIDTDFESSRILESKKFGMVYQYFPSTHHPSQRVSTKVKLCDDFTLEVRYWSSVPTQQGFVNKEVVIAKDLRQCTIMIVPEEVAQNRKRRWSKKFPISISWEKKSDVDSNSQIFLFPYTSREKEEWFRRMRSANEGKTYDKIIKEHKIFFQYMGKYMPHALSPQPEPAAAHVRHHHHHNRRTELRPGQRTKHGSHKQSTKLASEPVRFSMTSEIDDADDDTSVSISSNDLQSPTTFEPVQNIRSSSVKTAFPNPPVSSSITYGWMNAGLARLAWDLWHEERWMKWVQTRIQRKLIRIKTPSFMEPLKVTAIDMGMDMPIIKKPFKTPKLDSRGIWIYMEVHYKGTFNMTIETKLKLEPKFLSSGGGMQFNRGSESPPLSSHLPTPLMMENASVNKPHSHHRSRLMKARVNNNDPDEELSSGSDDDENMSNQLTKSLEEKLPIDLEEQGIPIYSSEDSGFGTSSSSSSSVTSTNEYNSTSGPTGRKEKILTNMVSRLQKIATKSRIVAKAAEKVSSYPMILSVEVKSLSGFLVINMAPPPSDALWYGFTVNPVLDLVAKPKVGQREVTLSYVTDWIEKKLCEVVEKKLVFPNMEDLVIPLLNSGLPEDKLLDLMTSPS